MIILTLWVFFTIVVAMIAGSKGQSGLVAFLVSIIVSPLIMGIAVLCRQNFKREEIEAKRHAELLEAARGGK